MFLWRSIRELEGRVPRVKAVRETEGKKGKDL